MAASASSLQLSMSIRSSSTSAFPQNERLFVGFSYVCCLRRPSLAFPQSRPPPSSSSRMFLSCAARRRNKSSNSPVPSSKKKKQSFSRKDDGEEDHLDDDAFEALFQQLAEDLKNDDLSLDDDEEEEDEISEEELAKLERELEEALGDDELMGLFKSVDDASEDEVEGNVDEEEDEGEVEEDESEEELEQELVELKRWQLKRLAYALKNGRRKTSIKQLAADLCLDRAVVLKLLRDPPPNLLMLSATLPDEPEPKILEPEASSLETVPSERGTDETKLEAKTDESKVEAKEKVQIHDKQQRWSAKKRIKKVHVGTLERVYQRAKRPTNTMISSIVHVTSLPRQTVVKWFEDKRAADGVSDHRKPYQPSASQTVFTS